MSVVEDNQMFKPIDGQISADEAVEIESLCVNCGKNGATKLLLTFIPFYKEVILSSFFCPHCSFSNNEIQSAGEIQSHGVKYVLRAQDAEDMNRKIVKSDFASVSIPELDLEIPSKSQKGEVTTVEGIILRVIEGLRQDQGKRLIEHPEEYEKIEEFIERAESLQGIRTNFTMILEDFSGNSFISPPSSLIKGQVDERLSFTKFTRSNTQDHLLGIYPELQAENKDPNEEVEQEELCDEIHKFPTICSSCHAACETKMKMVNIPYFKEVIVMATDCELCGNKTNEVKSGGGIEDKGKRIQLQVQNTEDLSRDVLKAETGSVEIPELELEVGSGTIGGKFTTIEGLLVSIKEQIFASNALFCGDSEPGMKEKLDKFSDNFDRCLSVSSPFRIILDDPAGNSYIQNIQAPDDDPQLEITDYDRTFDQNEELGLNDMKTENYESENTNQGISTIEEEQEELDS